MYHIGRHRLRQLLFSWIKFCSTLNTCASWNESVATTFYDRKSNHHMRSSPRWTVNGKLTLRFKISQYQSNDLMYPSQFSFASCPFSSTVYNDDGQYYCDQQSWKKFRIHSREVMYSIELWGSSFRGIEGKYILYIFLFPTIVIIRMANAHVLLHNVHRQHIDLFISWYCTMPMRVGLTILLAFSAILYLCDYLPSFKVTKVRGCCPTLYSWGGCLASTLCCFSSCSVSSLCPWSCSLSSTTAAPAPTPPSTSPTTAQNCTSSTSPPMQQNSYSISSRERYVMTACQSYPPLASSVVKVL